MNDTDIDNISTFLWNKVKQKIPDLNVFNLDFPLITIKKICDIDNVCTHILIKKKHKFLNCYFFIHSKLNHSHGFINEAEVNSLNVAKGLYFTHNFFNTKFNSFSNDDFNSKFEYFKIGIKNLFDIIINKLKFDNYYGKFIYEDSSTDIFHNSLNNIFKNSSTIETIIDECCVCRDETATCTNCNHPLCVKCYIKIKQKNYDDSKCPLCREHI